MNMSQGEKALSARVHAFLSLQLLDGCSGSRHLPAQSPALLGRKPAGQTPQQWQPRQLQPDKEKDPSSEQLPCTSSGPLPLAQL